MVDSRFIAEEVCGALSVVAFALMLLPQVSGSSIYTIAYVDDDTSVREANSVV